MRGSVIVDCIGRWCSKHDIQKLELMEWKGKVIDQVDELMKALLDIPSSKFHNECTSGKRPINYFE